jgi:hypothetical protein
VGYVCFSDTDLPAVRPWEIRRVKRHHPENVLEGKRFKCQPHKHLPNYDYSIWMDANVVLKVNPMQLLHWLGDADIALFRHPDRKCLYAEARACLGLRLDKPRRINEQIRRYKREGYDKSFGLYDCSFIIRKNTPEVNALGEAWWAEIRANSRRDQISFPYICWKCGIRPKIITKGNSRRGNPYIRHRHHRKKRGRR